MFCWQIYVIYVTYNKILNAGSRQSARQNAYLCLLWLFAKYGWIWDQWISSDKLRYEVESQYVNLIFFLSNNNAPFTKMIIGIVYWWTRKKLLFYFENGHIWISDKNSEIWHIWKAYIILFFIQFWCNCFCKLVAKRMCEWIS